MTVVEHTGPEGLLGTAMTLCNDAVENPDGTVQGEPTRQAETSYAVFCLKKKKNRQKTRMPSSA